MHNENHDHASGRGSHWYKLVKNTILAGGIFTILLTTWKIVDHEKHDTHPEPMGKKYEYVFVDVKSPIDSTKTYVLSATDPLLHIIDSLNKVVQELKKTSK